MTLSIARSEDKTLIDLKLLFQVIGGSLFIALFSQIKIPLFFTPVPLSLQTLAVMLIGVSMGKKMGTFAVLAYLIEVSAGLPFAAGGSSTPLALIGPTGGYMLGFLFLSYMTGWIAEKRYSLNSVTLPLCLSIVTFAVLGIGTAWLGTFTGFNQAISLGFYPFIPGEVLKTLIASYYIGKISRS